MIYRVTGENPDTMQDAEVYIRSDSLEQALEFAHASRGLNGVRGAVASAEEARGHPVFDAAAHKAGAPTAEALHRLAESPLIRRPVSTIALAVFIGVLAAMLLLRIL